MTEIEALDAKIRAAESGDGDQGRAAGRRRSHQR